MNYYLTEDGCLMHYGIQGQKWGKKNGPPYPLDASQASASEKRAGFSSKNGKVGTTYSDRYTKEQYDRDKQVYSKSAAKRIQKKVDEKGQGVQEARSYEATRIERARKAAKTMGTIGKYAGMVGGAVAGYELSKYVNKKYGHLEVMRDPYVNMVVTSAITGGMARAGKVLGREGLRSVTMLMSGYSPSKYR